MRLHSVLQSTPNARSFCTFCVCTGLLYNFKISNFYQICKGHSFHKHSNNWSYYLTYSEKPIHFPNFWGIQEGRFPGSSHFKSDCQLLSPTHGLASCRDWPVSSAHPLTFGHHLPTFFQYPKQRSALLHEPNLYQKFNRRRLQLLKKNLPLSTKTSLFLKLRSPATGDSHRLVGLFASLCHQ